MIRKLCKQLSENNERNSLCKYFFFNFFRKCDVVNWRYAQTELLNIQFNYFLMNCDNVRLRGEMTVKYSPRNVILKWGETAGDASDFPTSVKSIFYLHKCARNGLKWFTRPFFVTLKNTHLSEIYEKPAQPDPLSYCCFNNCQQQPALSKQALHTANHDSLQRPFCTIAFGSLPPYHFILVKAESCFQVYIPQLNVFCE